VNIPVFHASALLGISIKITGCKLVYYSLFIEAEGLEFMLFDEYIIIRAVISTIIKLRQNIATLKLTERFIQSITVSLQDLVVTSVFPIIDKLKPCNNCRNNQAL